MSTKAVPQINVQHSTPSEPVGSVV